MKLKEINFFISMLMINFSTSLSFENSGIEKDLDIEKGDHPRPSMPFRSPGSCSCACSDPSSSSNATSTSIFKSVKVYGKTFLIETSLRANWHKATQFCAFHRMRLASIKSEGEQLSLESALKMIDGKMDYWISGNDIAEEGTFAWGDGESFTSNDKNFGYTHWAQNEPNNLGGDEDCVELLSYQNFEWNDVGSNEKHFFICEF